MAGQVSAWQSATDTTCFSLGGRVVRPVRQSSSRCAMNNPPFHPKRHHGKVGCHKRHPPAVRNPPQAETTIANNNISILEAEQPISSSSSQLKMSSRAK